MILFILSYPTHITGNENLVDRHLPGPPLTLIVNFVLHENSGQLQRVANTAYSLDFVAYDQASPDIMVK